MAFALPIEYKFGFVSGRVVRAVADSVADQDALPDAAPVVGKVRFTPRQQRRSTGTALVIHEPIETSLDADGYVHDGQRRGIWLMEGVWDVKFTLTSGTIPDFPVTVTVEHTLAAPLDLATAVPYTPPLAPLKVVTEEMAQAVLLALETGGQGPAGTITGATATALPTGSSPTVSLGGTLSARTFTFGIPAGPTGAAGAPGAAGTITGASVTPLAAGATPTVALGGTSTARTFTFGIPAGAKGDTGAPGATTIAGISGLQSALDAKATTAALNTKATLTAVGATSSGRIILAKTSTPSGMQAGDIIIVVP